MYGAIEAGGTKFVCAVGTGPSDVRARVRIETAEPEGTLTEVTTFFADQVGDDSLEAVGMATFGPVELRSDHPDYGHITTTPKPGWPGWAVPPRSSARRSGSSRTTGTSSSTTS